MEAVSWAVGIRLSGKGHRGHGHQATDGGEASRTGSCWT